MGVAANFVRHPSKVFQARQHGDEVVRFCVIHGRSIPHSPDARISRTTAVCFPLIVSFRKALLGKHRHARLIALGCAGRTGHQSRFDDPADAVGGMGHGKVWGTKAKPAGCVPPAALLFEQLLFLRLFQISVA